MEFWSLVYKYYYLYVKSKKKGVNFNKDHVWLNVTSFQILLLHHPFLNYSIINFSIYVAGGWRLRNLDSGSLLLTVKSTLWNTWCTIFIIKVVLFFHSWLIVKVRSFIFTYLPLFMDKRCDILTCSSYSFQYFTHSPESMTVKIIYICMYNCINIYIC